MSQRDQQRLEVEPVADHGELVDFFGQPDHCHAPVLDEHGKSDRTVGPERRVVSERSNGLEHGRVLGLLRRSLDQRAEADRVLSDIAPCRVGRKVQRHALGRGGSGESDDVVGRQIMIDEHPNWSCRFAHALTIAPLRRAAQGRKTGVPTPPALRVACVFGPGRA